MILFFSGTGNSLFVSRKIADATGDAVMPFAGAAGLDLSGERQVGLVYPSYDFNAPPAVRELVGQLRVSPQAYIFIVITCGAQAGNSAWTVQRQLKRMGCHVVYCNKLRMPDNSAVAFSRNPNEQVWKFDKFAPRLEQIVDDIRQRKSGRHYGGFSLVGWLTGLPAVERKLLAAFRPVPNADRCVGCGICAKVCPVGNIAMRTLEGGRSVAVAGDGCSVCLGCLHFCPQQAVELRGKAPNKACQYHHLDIKVAELQRNQHLQ